MTVEQLVAAASQIADRWPDAEVRYSPMGRLCVYPPGDPAPVAVLEPSGVLSVFDFDETVDS